MIIVVETIVDPTNGIAWQELLIELVRAKRMLMNKSHADYLDENN